MHSNFDVVVLGAGISGLVSAAVLADQGVERIVVVDEYPYAGGNHIDRAVDNYTFDVGSFIFQDDSPLLRHFPDLLPLYVPIDPTFGRLNPQGAVTKYPFSIDGDLLIAGPVEVARILLSVAFARVFHRRQSDAKTFARYWIGERLLARSGLEHYMRRFYGADADQIDLGFAHKRMLWIKEHASIGTHVRRFFKPLGKPTNTQLARPREGFASLYRLAVESLEKRGVSFVFNAQLVGLAKTERGFALHTKDRSVESQRVVSTIPLPRVHALLGLPPVESLTTVTLISLFFSFEGARGFSQSVLFNFSATGAWKRLTMHSDFYGSAEGREFFGVEVNASAACATVADAERDFRAHTAANGLFRGDLRLEGSHALSSAYPIYMHGAGARAEDALQALRALGIESFGRQGGFDYQPTARVSTIEAEQRLGQKY